MISRRILATVAVLCTLIAPAHAQKTKAELNTEIGTSFPDPGPITPSNLRNVASDIVNSIMPAAPVVSGNLSCFSGTTGLLQDCGRSITLNDVKLGPNSSTLPHPPILAGSVFTGASATEVNTFGNLISYGTGNLPGFVVLKARGTQATPTAAKKDDILGIFSGLGYGTTGFGIGGAQVSINATQDYTDFNQGGRVDIQVSPNSFGQDVVTTARFDQDGTLKLGPNVATLTNPVTTLISHVGALITGAMATNQNTFADLHSYGSPGAPGYVTNRARGTQSAPSGVLSGDILGLSQYGGYGTTGYGLGGAKVLGTASQNWTDSNQGAYLSLFSTPNNTASEVEGFRLNQDATVLIGPGASTLTSSVGALLTAANATGSNTFANLLAYGSPGAPGFVTHRARGTQASPSGAHSGDILGLLHFGGYGTTGFGWAGAQLQGIASEDWSDSNQGTYLAFRYTPNGANVAAEGFRLTQSGALALGVTTDSGNGTLQLKKQTFASLTACVTATEGAMAAVTDSSTATWGATITGNSTNHVLAYCNNANWTVAGK
jgi:hypothetical protein